MHVSLVDFGHDLRRSGIPVSQAELMDASRAMNSVVLRERSNFKDALRATLIKRTRDIPLFDALFEVHFSRVEVPGSVPGDDGGESLDDRGARVEDVRSVSDASLSPVTELVLTGRPGPLVRLVLNRLEAMEIDRMSTAPLRGRFFLNRLKREVGVEQIQAELDGFLSELQRSSPDEERVRAIRDYAHRNLARLEQMLADLVQREIEKSRFQALQRIKVEDIAERNLFQLSEQEIREMRPVVDRLARRLKDRLSLRLRRADLGRFDLKTTFRKNIGYGGPLPDLRFRKRKPARPQIVALCDVSRSVRNFSRFMLLFLYTLKEVVARVRSFIFVGDLAEVTLLFQQYDLNEAVSLAASGCGLAYPFGTDYGTSFSQFVEEHLMSVNSKTTVIILGDARTNGLPPRVDALKAFADRARKVIWLNPESSLTWSLGDSVMHLYQPLCSTVAECGNLTELSRVIEDNIGP